VHGDVIGVNKFLLRFSNQELEVPENLQSESDKPPSALPHDVQRTLEIDPGSARALAEQARQQIARQRAEIAARGGDSLGPPLPREPLSRRELPPPEAPAARSPSLAVLVGGAIVGGVMIAGLLLAIL
jgi:hypothetical protein